jgi:GH15 family glucan-1,4-alpha-glucosidase
VQITVIGHFGILYEGAITTTRHVVVGNGSLAIALDKNLRIRDLFYPRVGLENHIGGHEFLLGVWMDGVFSWIGDDWNISSDYLPETLVSRCLAANPKFHIELEINDAVYSFLDVYLRKIVVRNRDASGHEIRLFFSQDFHIYGEDSGDTVLYEPSLKGIIHYKRNRYFLVNGETELNERFYEFATGQKESFGREGTWRDAEDGSLSGNMIAQGSVDSTVSFRLELNAESEQAIYYWIACGKTLEKVKDLDLLVKKAGVEQLLLETENYWSAWVNKEGMDLNILPREIRRLVKTSLLVMRTHVDSNGGIIASCDSDVLQFNRDTYSYVWPRDAAICAMAFDTFGFQEVSRLFFEFCNKVIADEGYFRHKYWSDGSTGSSWHALLGVDGKPQLPIQLDETALVLIALWNHFQKYRDLEFISKVYPRLVVKATEFMLDHRDDKTGLPEPTFDVWEERTGIFTSTAAMVCSALSCAAKFSKVFYDSERQSYLNEIVKQMKESIITHLYDKKLKRFIKAIYPDNSRNITVDSSLLMASIYGIFDSKDKAMKETVDAMVERLWLSEGIGGLARYEDDAYHRVPESVHGNPWPVCTLWLGRWYSRTAKSFEDLSKSLDILFWATKTSLPSGLLAEQLNPFDAKPLSVSPLVWSHAEFVMAAKEYLDSYRHLQSNEIK